MCYVCNISCIMGHALLKPVLTPAALHAGERPLLPRPQLLHAGASKKPPGRELITISTYTLGMKMA